MIQEFLPFLFLQEFVVIKLYYQMHKMTENRMNFTEHSKLFDDLCEQAQNRFLKQTLYCV